MRLGVVLAPVADPNAVVDAAKAAEAAGMDAVSLWDHYHSGKPEWAYAAGWSMYGAIAAATERVQIVPMVLNGLHHDVGRLSKEVAMLDRLSGGRFELAIGIGDWPESFRAWGQPFPPRAERTARLVETLGALEALWRGDPMTISGTHVNLNSAVVAPVPSTPVRIVGGAGASRRVISDLAPLVDELNVYPEPELVDAAREAARASDRCRSVSIHANWSWEDWPSDPAAALAGLRELGVDRAFIAIGGIDMPERMAQLAAGNR
jgi:alkanesulfonate monooxygenase SsuD/methylene tetrahydromethanopterin reductase-like flavin-dependent oxidoreductase (luciferase family)